MADKALIQKTLEDDLNKSVIIATCEKVIHIIDGRVDRSLSDEIGLNLFDFDK